MFTRQQIKAWLDARPFKPFRLAMANGRTYDIPNPGGAHVWSDKVSVGMNFDADGVAEFGVRYPLSQIIRITKLKRSEWWQWKTKLTITISHDKTTRRFKAECSQIGAARQGRTPGSALANLRTAADLHLKSFPCP